MVEVIAAGESCNAIRSYQRCEAELIKAIMGTLYEHITDRLEAFIERQHIFYVATAPLQESGHVNLSPKGQDTFVILDPHTVAYQDFSGSGAETIAHLKQNGRITIMFYAFEGPPFILRLYGKGEVLANHRVYCGES